jgi:integrative and conjugative element protein (TIGR02256 family)
MSFKRIAVCSTALERIKTLVKTSKSLEIGGPMVGYISNETLVIADVSGPGPHGKCLPYSVTIDGDHSKTFCDSAYASSNGKLDFVGDWHCHPSTSLRPSEGDRRAMQLLAETPGLPSNPVSLIYSSILGTYRVFAWHKSTSRLIALPRGRYIVDC